MKALDLTLKPTLGTNLIEASAGTGKTFSISNLYLHFILQGKAVQEILVVTFTEAATKELKERIRENLHVAKRVLLKLEKDSTLEAILNLYSNPLNLIDQALINFDQASIFTIHGFCQRMLLEHAFESSSLFEKELLNDDGPILEQIVNDFWRREIYPLKELELNFLSLKREDLLSLCKQLEQQPELFFVDEMDEGKWQSTLNEYQNLLQQCHRVLKQFEEHKEEISERLYSGALNGRSYRKSSFEKKFQDLSACLTKGQANQEVLDYFGKNIEAKCNKGKMAPQHKCFDMCIELSDLSWPDMSKKFNLYLKHKFREQLPNELMDIKLRLQVMTFSDLISELYHALMSEAEHGPLHQKIREKYRAVLVDEFQDTDPKQYQIFNSVFGSSREHFFYMIGDPKQSIYAFRGADVLAYLKAKKDAVHQYTLDTNYRSEKGMVDAVNTFFDFKGRNEAFAYAPHGEEEGIVFEPVKSGAKKRVLCGSDAKPLQLNWFENPDSSEPYSKSQVMHHFKLQVCKQIVELLSASKENRVYFQGPVTHEKEEVQPGDLAVLVNTHHQALELKNDLLKLGVPSVIKKSGDVFKTTEAKNVLHFLTAVKEPNNHHIMPLWLSSFFNDDALEIQSTMTEQSLNFLTELTEYQQKWNDVGILRSLQQFMLKHDIEKRLLTRPGGERALTNLKHCREILHGIEREQGFGLEQLIRFLNEKIQSDAKEDEKYLQRLETDSEAVQIMTVFKSKGLEFPIVFCPYLWAESFCESERGVGKNYRGNDFAFYYEHDGDTCRALSLDEHHPDRVIYRKQWRREKLGEQLRLLYVALTRSSNRCYIYWGNIKDNPNAFSYLAQESLLGHDLLSKEKSEFGFDQRKEKQVWKEQLTKHQHIGFSTFYESRAKSLDLKSVEEIRLQNPPKNPMMNHHWTIGSYTSLSKSKVEKTTQFEDVQLQIDDDDHYEETEVVEKTGFFAFPKGALAGTVVHEIIESIDFQESSHWQTQVEQKLLQYRFIPDRDSLESKTMIESCVDMLAHVVGAKLFSNQDAYFRLSEITASHRINEMEFYYPCANIQLKDLIGLFAKHYGDLEIKKEYVTELEKLTYKMKSGFLTGSIDCIVECQNKYYLIDWKSNYLGHRSLDYQREDLQKQINEAKYFLQFHIYAIALHVLLSQRLGDDYDYEQHFGGVFYLFVRGMQKDLETGVFYEKIPFSLIQEMTALMLGEGV